MTGAEIAVSLGIAFCLGSLWADWLQRRAEKRESPESPAVTARLPIPCVESLDGRSIEPDELRAVSWLLACQANALAAHMHAVAIECVIAQVAADEAAATDLDQLLKEQS